MIPGCCGDMRAKVIRTLPGADAVGIGSHHAATGDMALGYFNNDMVASQAQGSGGDATTIAFGLDPDQNRILTEATTTSAGTKTLTNHYDDASDETAWTSTVKTDGTTVTKRYVDGIDGDLAATVADDGTVKLALANLHGDTVDTIYPDATSIASYHETTEYGLPRDAASAADDYGWLGAKKRSSDDLGGLTLMGVRLYNPATGRFLSVDPIPGGNANAYVYPPDPIDFMDPTGASQNAADRSGRQKCKCTSQNSWWLPYGIGRAAWGSWGTDANWDPGDGGGWTEIKRWASTIFDTAVHIRPVYRQIRHGVRYTMLRRCHNGYWQYDFETIRLAQYRWRIRLTLVGPIDHYVWANGATSVHITHDIHY